MSHTLNGVQYVSPKERKLAFEVATTGRVAVAAPAAGYSRAAAYAAISKPEVQAEIRRVQQERLFSEVLPLAVNVHIALLKDPKTPAGAKVSAVKLAYDRAFGPDNDLANKEPHEMTADELAKAIEAMEAQRGELANRAKVIEHEPAGVFD